MPGLSHPKAQRLCLCPPMAERRAFCLSFMFIKPTLQPMTQCRGRGPAWASPPTSGRFPHCHNFVQSCPPIGTCHLPLEGLSCGEEEAALPKENVKSQGSQPFAQVLSDSQPKAELNAGNPVILVLFVPPPCKAKLHGFQLFAFVLARRNIFITFSITYCMSFCCLLGGSVFYYKFGTIYYCLVFVLCLRNGHFFFYYG